MPSFYLSALKGGVLWRIEAVKGNKIILTIFFVYDRMVVEKIKAERSFRVLLRFCTKEEK